MGKKNKWKYYCQTEGKVIKEKLDIDDPAPTVCKNDAGHTVDWTSRTIGKKIKFNKEEKVAGAPTTTDDADSNFNIGSIWVNTSDNSANICVDDTAGAAVWTSITAGAAGGEINDGTNVGTAGVGIFKAKNGVDLEFKKINKGSNKVSVTDDTGNNEVDIDLVEGNIVIGNLSGAPSGTVVGTTDTQTLSNKILTTPWINDLSSNNEYRFVASELSGDRNVTLPLLTAHDTFVFENHIQTLDCKTLTNATLDTSMLITPWIHDISCDHEYKFVVSELTADRDITLPLLIADDTFVFENHIQTLTNKTLTNPVIGTIINTGTLTLPTSTDTLVGRDTTDTLTNKTLTSPIIGTIINTGTLTLPTSTDTLVGRDTIDILTNKTLTAPQINDSVGDKQYIFGVSDLGEDRTITLPLLVANDTFVFEDHIQTLTNKTLTSPVLTTPQINDTSLDHQYIFATSELTADRTITLPLLGTNDTFVFENHIQTLDCKTLTNATLDTSMLITPWIHDISCDHEYKFVVSELTADRNITLPLLTANDTFVFENHIQTLTNKTLTNPVIGTIINTGTLTLPTSTDTLVGRDTTDTLTNKTLTSPIIGTIINTGTLTLPTSTDTLVGRDTIDILTNKTLTAPQINDSVGDKQYILGVSDLGGDRTITLPLLIANDTFVFENHIQTMTNKTLTSPVLTTPQINDTSLDHQYIFATSELTADRTITLPLLGDDDTFVFKDHVQTLTNKTLTTPWINDLDEAKKYKFVVSNLVVDRNITLPLLTADDTFVFENHVQTLTNKVLTAPQISDSVGDKQYIFGVSDLSADRTITLPLLAANDTFVFENHIQTLTNKTLTSPVITNSVLTAPQINDSVGDCQYIFGVSDLAADRTITLPLLGADDTFVFKDHVQTLTNKTIDFADASNNSITGRSQVIPICSSTSMYKSVTAASWTGVAQFIYRGKTVEGSPSNIKISCYVTGGSLDVKIYSISNSKTICQNTAITNTSDSIVDLGSLSDIPNGESIFEVQLKGDGTDTIYVSSVALYW